jgi:lipoprotein-releasing system permease protein
MWLPGWSYTLIRRHLWSRRARPAVQWMNRFAFTGLFVGVVAWTAVVSVMSGLQGEIKDKILRERPHLLWEGSPTSGLREKEAALKKRFGASIREIRFLLQSEGLLEVPSQTSRGRILGSGIVIQGADDVKPGTFRPGVELGQLMSFEPGYEVRVRSPWKLEAIPLQLKMTEDFETGLYDIDRSLLRIARTELEEWLGLQGAVSRIEVSLHDPFLADELKSEFSTLSGLPFLSWQQTQASLWYSLRLEKAAMSVAVFFIILLAALAVHLALSVRVTEKTREIALLRALGVEARLLSRVYLTEGTILGLAASTAGLFGGWILTRIISNPRFFRLPDVFYSTSIAVEWNWPVNIGLAAFATILALLASWGPARKVARIEIHEALRS